MIKYFKVLFFLCIAVGQSNGFIINDIEVVGNEIISDDNIKFISGLEQGMYVNSFNIQNSIKRLWDTKRYLDIDIKVEEKYLSNKLIIYVKEAPFLGSIIIKGNKKISTKKILSEIDNSVYHHSEYQFHLISF